MRKALTLVAGLVLCLAAMARAGGPDCTWELSVQVSATVQEQPAQITLSWPQDSQIRPIKYLVSRKAPGTAAWGPAVTLPGSATHYTDRAVSRGMAYEYQVIKTTAHYTGYGYIVAGMDVPLTENRGKLLLVIDETYAKELASELGRLQEDLAGDGWQVVPLEVSRQDSPTWIKTLIKAQYEADPNLVKAVFLFGHVPVPYSGEIVPDGHVPDHEGAWPADGYYADMDGVWTDSTVRTTKATDPRNQNVPGDGKFDQSTFPAALRLMLGRVDLANLPGRLVPAGPATFPSELELLRRYLNKNHAFRTGQMDLPRRGVVGDYFGYRDGEAFAASGWRNFAPFFGAANITFLPKEATWIPTLNTNAFLWAYGCGPGSYTSIGGLGQSDTYNDGVTTELVHNDIRAAFTLLFGSWLGDWDSEDNIQRSVLASPSYGLACAWSGRPHWFLQHMALGETLGFSTRLTQNNGAEGPYRTQRNSCAGLVHIALMGDPTLRMHVVPPPTGLISQRDAERTTLSWNRSPDPAVLGYHVYRARNVSDSFERVTLDPLSATTFCDSGSPGARYMVRAVKRELTASGTYMNLSQGVFTGPAATGEPAAIASGPGHPAVAPTISRPASPLAAPSATGTDTPGVVVWVDDAVPGGATTGANGGDAWNWVAGGPAPFSGTVSHQSTVAAGLHEHYFAWATAPLAIQTGDTLFAYVYLDPANPPSEIMLQWFDTSWEHRAYWGANNISNGTDGTATRRYMGPLPAAGQWVLLQVPASLVGLEGTAISGMVFTQFDGRAAWDYAGKSAQTLTTTTQTPVTSTNEVVWIDDALPAGATPGVDGGDSWSWISANPAPQVGTQAHTSSTGSGLHQHFFFSAAATLTVNSGESLYAWVYPDPANPPQEIMVQWNNGTWEHRAYWGAAMISYGADGTPSSRYMGPLPAPGRWTRLEIPASQVGLENTTLNGMAFTLYSGQATWDAAGKASTTSTNSTNTGNSPSGTGTNNVAGTTTTNSVPTTAPDPSTGIVVTNSLPGASTLDYIGLRMPTVGDTALKILTPTLLELKLLNTKQPDPARVTQWDLVDSSGQFTSPPLGAFNVKANGQAIAVQRIGFRRRPFYAPFSGYDLRIENSMYLQLASPVSENQLVEVNNPDGSLWPATTRFSATMDPLRYSAAIHVNQEGYLPGYSKKAMIGAYAGSLGEVVLPTGAGFRIVDANTGAQVFQGTLVQRPDVGYTYSPTPYQQVYEADFTSFNTVGAYRLVVPGLGGSLPFRIDSGVAMAFARTYALGLYHQRCGTNTAMPFTRFEHAPCHAAPASVPLPQSNYSFTWNTIAGYARTINSDNPPQIAPALTNVSAQLFPFVRQGSLDVSGGHHDAGDYSKYLNNSASLVHYLMFAVDALPGVAALDNLGIPESGDGISDVLQEAKWEADFLAKMQDSDGGFYFLVYPVNREYEGTLPENGDPQVVWPKTTSVTGAAVAALAQCASSPQFKRAYPAEAAAYLAKAKLGWQFLLNAITKYGKNGAYQKITHYGDGFADNDEMAWAACEIYLATGDQNAHTLLRQWFDPADPATMLWGWWRLSQCYGNAIRSYAFAVPSGRVSAAQLDATWLAKCQTQVLAAGDDMVTFARENAYGSSFPDATKRVKAAGWYFSTDQAFDLAVANALSPKQQYMEALLSNMNFEGGCNPVNVCYITGLGWKRQRDVVSQWAFNDTRVLPPSGEPVGNITANFSYLWNYGGVLSGLCYPSDGAATAPYPFYDRWADNWNVTAEFVVLNSARSIGTLGYLAAQTSLKTQAWRAPAGATLALPTYTTPVGRAVTITMQAPGLDLSTARITWEARDQEPAFGQSFTFAPVNNGTHWVEAEAQFPDGRRVFAKGTFEVNSPNVVWFDDALPAGATAGADGGDSWNWVTSNPAPYSGTAAHSSAIASGAHQHFFTGASSTLTISTGDILYAWAYLDPNNLPREMMLHWFDGSSWEHRAYWGENILTYGAVGTAGRYYAGPLPAAGQWVQLKVPASAVGLEGKTISGMSFGLYGGRVTWDATGRLNTSVYVTATTTSLSRLTADSGAVVFTRDGDLSQPLQVAYSVGGTAIAGVDYQIISTDPANSVVIPAGVTSKVVNLTALTCTNLVGPKMVSLNLAPNPTYSITQPAQVQVNLGGNAVSARLSVSASGAALSWDSLSNRTYQVFYKSNLTDAWTPGARVTATNNPTVYLDPGAPRQSQRFYAVGQVN